MACVKMHYRASTEQSPEPKVFCLVGVHVSHRQVAD